MTGRLGNIKGITQLKEKYNFRLLVDDAHGFGTMGANGRGTGEEMGCQDKIDIYFATFAKSMAGIGAFVASNKEVISFLRYNMRSQVFAKSLPMPMVIGAQKRLELLRTKPELRTKLWTIVKAMQSGLIAEGFDINKSESPVTPVVLKGQVWEATNMLHDIRSNYKIFFSAVIYPVIPKGIIIYRLIPTASHTLEDVDYTIKAFAAINTKLKAGVYNTGEIVNVFE
jgi:glycine C-acetyltransferase